MGCSVAEGLAGFLDCFELLLEAFEDLFFVLAEFPATGGYGFEVVDLLLYLFGVALCEALVAFGCDVGLACGMD